jgi:L-ascorbate metabolism protein UlaG (beta-lactamase superfamily)
VRVRGQAVVTAGDHTPEELTVRRVAFSALCFITPVLLAAVGSAEAQPLQVTYVGNAGFLVQMGKKKILIDGCFRGFAGAYLLPQEIQDKQAKAQPPFDGIDLILATHAHGDHFDSELVRRHLQSNPKAVFASTRQATAPLMDLPGRVLSFEASRGRPDRKDVAGIQVEALYLSHGAPAAGRTEILNYGYVVSVGGFSVFHTGDIDPSHVTFEELRAYDLAGKKLDVAFIQHYCLLGDASDRRLVREGIGARRIIPSHYHLTDPPFRAVAVLGQYPDAIVFQKEMETWVDSALFPARRDGRARNSRNSFTTDGNPRRMSPSASGRFDHDR